MRKSALQAELLVWRRAVGRVFAGLRRDKDLSQTEFGKLVGWSRDKVSKFEQGKREVEYGDIVVMARTLGEPLESVLNSIHRWFNRHKPK